MSNFRRIIQSLEDERLQKIDPTQPGFWDKVLRSEQPSNNPTGYVNFLKKIIGNVVKTTPPEALTPFWMPIFNPTWDENQGLIFKDGFDEKQMQRHNYYWWCREIGKLPPVYGKAWLNGYSFQYFAMLVWLINSLTDSTGWPVEKVIMLFEDKRNIGPNGQYRKDLDSKVGPKIMSICDSLMVPKFISINKEKTFGVVGEQYTWDLDIEYCLATIELYQHNLLDEIRGLEPIEYGYFGPISVGWPIIV